MRRNLNPKPFSMAALGALVAGSLLVLAANAQPPKPATDREITPPRPLPLVLGQPLPLVVNSPGVEWKGTTYYLVKLGSIQFTLDQTNRLKADINASVLTFDDVSYDISGAVFDAAGALLGTARAQCHVDRLWVGRLLTREVTITLDFGVSLDYARAAAFMVSVSKCKVLTPDQWQK